MKYVAPALIVALAGCLPADLTTTSSPAQSQTAAAPAQPEAPPLPQEIVAPVSTGLPVTATLDCSVGSIGLFGRCEDTAAGICTAAGLTVANLQEIDPANPGVSGIATDFGPIVEGENAPATHRVTCV